jgi:hypothetical protein
VRGSKGKECCQYERDVNAMNQITIRNQRETVIIAVYFSQASVFHDVKHF